MSFLTLVTKPVTSFAGHVSTCCCLLIVCLHSFRQFDCCVVKVCRLRSITKELSYKQSKLLL